MLIESYLLAFHNKGDSSGPEPTFATHSGVQILYFKDFGGDDELQNELRNPVPSFDCEVGVCVVEEDDSHRATVVGVDHSCASVNRVLPCQSRAGSCGRNRVQKGLSENWQSLNLHEYKPLHFDFFMNHVFVVKIKEEIIRMNMD